MHIQIFLLKVSRGMKKILGLESSMILVKLTQPGSISTSLILRPKSNSLILTPSSLPWL